MKREVVGYLVRGEATSLAAPWPMAAGYPSILENSVEVSSSEPEEASLGHLRWAEGLLSSGC